MAWTGVPSSSLTSPQSTDMRVYELTQQLRSMQIVQAEQARRLDEQSYRLHQLEMKEMQVQKLESQRYLWGPGAVGETSGRALTGLGFEVFSPNKEKEEMRLVPEEKVVVKGMDIFLDGVADVRPRIEWKCD